MICKVSAGRFPMRPVVGVRWTCPLLVSYVAGHGTSESQKDWTRSVLESSESPDDIGLYFATVKPTIVLLRPPSGGRSASRSITRDGPALAYGLADDNTRVIPEAAAAGHRLFVGTTPAGARARPHRARMRVPSVAVDSHRVLAAADLVGISHELGLPLDVNFLALASLQRPGSGVTRTDTGDPDVAREKMVDLCDLHWPKKGGDGNLIAEAYRSMCGKLDDIP